MKKLVLVVMVVFLFSSLALAQDLRNLGQHFRQQINTSGMERRVEAINNGVKESLIYFNKEGKEFVLQSVTIMKENLEQVKVQLEANLAVLNDANKTKETKDALTAQLADVNTKLDLITEKTDVSPIN